MSETPAMAAAKQIITRCASPPSDSPTLNESMATARTALATKPYRVAHILAQSKLPNPPDATPIDTTHLNLLNDLATALISEANSQAAVPPSAYLPFALSDGEKEDYYDTVNFKAEYAARKEKIAQQSQAVQASYESVMMVGEKGRARGEKKEEEEGGFVSRLPRRVKSAARRDSFRSEGGDVY